jgi:acyl-CoA thioesterase FadM
MYRFRFVMIMFRCLASRPIRLTAERTLSFRAMPVFDIDVSRMFTHSYGRFTELGRWHLMFGSDFRAIALKNRWTPVTTGEVIRYRRSVGSLQKIDVRTRIVHWDDRRFYISHVITSNGLVVANSLVDGVIRGPSGILRPSEAFSAAGMDETPSPASDEILAQVRALQAFNAEVP